MGMFDRLWLTCPSCGSSVEVQSKCGPCELNEYTIATAPLAVIADANEDGIHGNITCEMCTAQLEVAVDFSVNVRVKDSPLSAVIRSA